MIKGAKDIFILILAITCLVVSLVFLPWSELNFTANFPDWLSGAMTKLGITKFFIDLANHNQLVELIKANHAQDHLGDYAYSLFLFLAITVAATAIILIGKEDNSEKTVLQVKQ